MSSMYSNGYNKSAGAAMNGYYGAVRVGYNGMNGVNGLGQVGRVASVPAMGYVNGAPAAGANGFNAYGGQMNGYQRYNVGQGQQVVRGAVNAVQGAQAW